MQTLWNFFQWYSFLGSQEQFHQILDSSRFRESFQIFALKNNKKTIFFWLFSKFNQENCKKFPYSFSMKKLNYFPSISTGFFLLIIICHQNNKNNNNNNNSIKPGQSNKGEEYKKRRKIHVFHAHYYDLFLQETKRRKKESVPFLLDYLKKTLGFFVFC